MGAGAAKRQAMALQSEQLDMQRQEIADRKKEEEKTRRQKRNITTSEAARRTATSNAPSLRSSIITGSQGVKAQTPIVGGF